MKTLRIIPRLDIKGPNLVKGIHLEGLRVLGKPEEFAYKYYLDGADELIYMDVVASLYGRNSLLDIVKKTASTIFIPFTVGGGLRTIEDMKMVLRAGADKVAINTAAVKNPQLISEAARVFGSQCIVLSIEAKKIGDRYEAYTDNGREKTGLDVFEWAERAYELGAGEILLTSIDRDGTGNGYDIELVKRVSTSLPIPVIACGGAGKIEDFADLAVNGEADAVSAASVFHYNRIAEIVDEDKFKAEGNIEFLKTHAAGKGSVNTTKVNLVSIPRVKESLSLRGFVCRGKT